MEVIFSSLFFFTCYSDCLTYTATKVWIVGHWDWLGCPSPFLYQVLEPPASFFSSYFDRIYLYMFDLSPFLCFCYGLAICHQGGILHGPMVGSLARVRLASYAHFYRNAYFHTACWSCIFFFTGENQALLIDPSQYSTVGTVKNWHGNSMYCRSRYFISCSGHTSL